MITLLNISGKKYLVLGASPSAEAIVNTLKASKAYYSVWDPHEKNRTNLREAGYPVCDPSTLDPSEYQGVVLASDVNPCHELIQPIITRFQAARAQIMTDIDLLFQACPLATYIGISGSSGKSLTTALIAHILSNPYRKVQTGSPKGNPVLALQPLGADSNAVLHITPHQLDLLQINRLRVAVLLSINPPFAPGYSAFSNYTEAFSKIISRQSPQTLVIGTDDQETKSLYESVRNYRHLQIEEISTEHDVRSGIEVRESLMVAHRQTGSRVICDLETLPFLKARPYWACVCAAFAACRAIGLSFETIEHGLKSFPGLPHFHHIVTTRNGIAYVNDSYSTNLISTRKTLGLFKNIYWIGGGTSSPLSFSEVGFDFPQIRKAYFYGENREQLAKLGGGAFHSELCQSLTEAFEKASQDAQKASEKDSTVLFSPGSLPYDEFNSFQERGKFFISLIETMKLHMK